MSEVACRCVGVMQGDICAESLAQRLLTLRAEIDAILGQLAGHTTLLHSHSVELPSALEAVADSDAHRAEQAEARDETVPAAMSLASAGGSSDRAGPEREEPAPVVVRQTGAERDEPSRLVMRLAAVACEGEGEDAEGDEIEHVHSRELTRIAGVDEALAAALHRLGVTTFAEIAGWSGDDVARISAALQLGRRISVQNWIEQAALLAGGATTAFARRQAEPDSVAYGCWQGASCDAESLATCSEADGYLSPVDSAVPAGAADRPAIAADTFKATPSPSEPSVRVPSAGAVIDRHEAPGPQGQGAVVALDTRRGKERTRLSLLPRRDRAAMQVAAILAALLAAAAMISRERTAFGTVQALLPAAQPASRASGDGWAWLLKLWPGSGSLSTATPDLNRELSLPPFGA